MQRLLSTLIFVLFFSISSHAKVSLFFNTEVIHSEFVVRVNDPKVLDDLLPMAKVKEIAPKTFLVSVEQKALSQSETYTSQAIQMMKSISSVAGVESVEPNQLYYAAGLNASTAALEPREDHLPDDPYLYHQWYLFRTHTDAAWKYGHGSRYVPVAVVDSGISYSHHDLRDNLWVGYRNGYPIHGVNTIAKNYNAHDDNGHGTAVAGVIGATGNNGFGISGINWDASLMAVKFLEANGSGSLSNAIEAIYWAVDNGARVINASWGGGSYSRALEEAIRYADSRDVLFVAATGNSQSAIPSYPAAYDVPNVIAVAGTDENDWIDRWAGTPETIDIAAPCTNIVTTGVRGDLIKVTAGSFSTAQVSGALALAISIAPHYTAPELKALLFESADKLDTLRGYVGNDGARLNVRRLLKSLE